MSLTGQVAPSDLFLASTLPASNCTPGALTKDDLATATFTSDPLGEAAVVTVTAG